MNITINHLEECKQKQEKFSCLTVYDASMARIISEQGVEVMLVGDTMGQVIQGHPTTLPVTIDNIVYHLQCVARANQGSLLIGDMPFMSFSTPDKALENATKLMQAGAQMIKMEGDIWLSDTAKRLTECGIPVCCHIGLTPQSVHQFGGYKVQGKQDNQAEHLFNTAKALEEAGVRLLVLECIPQSLAAEITNMLTIPTIGIGAGVHCDGQILVLPDMLGMTPKVARFVRNFLVPPNDSIQKAIKNYHDAVKSGEFPGIEHGYN